MVFYCLSAVDMKSGDGLTMMTIGLTLSYSFDA